MKVNAGGKYYESEYALFDREHRLFSCGHLDPVPETKEFLSLCH